MGADVSVSLIGSTGSIGLQTLDVIRRLGNVSVCALTASRSVDAIESQIREFRPQVAAMADRASAMELSDRVSDTPTVVMSGPEGIAAAACWEAAGTVVVAASGDAGILPAWEAVSAGKTVALANKESLVSCGSLLISQAARRGARIIPVDSEHSAIFQCLRGADSNPVRRIILTCSGGPFRKLSARELERVSAADALRHPTWNMGAKITVDSATLMNKGLEVIEARWLFGVDAASIRVHVHPQSVVHSAVEFEDGSVIAQLGVPDMRVPIQYALTFPARVASPAPALDLFSCGPLEFFEPDTARFPCLRLAYDALDVSGTMPAVMNSANEEAVSAFLAGKIGFTRIPEIIRRAMDSADVVYNGSLEDILEAGRAARASAAESVKTFAR